MTLPVSSQTLAATMQTGGSAGYLALLLLVLLFIATFLLVRNMGRRLDRLPKDFPEEPATPAPDDPSSPRT